MSRSIDSKDGVNFVLMPKIEKNARSAEYIGLPSVQRSIKYLLREISSVKRFQFGAQQSSAAASSQANATAYTGFTEKKW